MDLRTLLLGEEDWEFLLQVPLRAGVMFIVALIALRLIGKRGIMQGVFELLAIIILGSAAGDPIFYQKVGLLPSILVFAMIVLLYKLFNRLISVNKTLEHLIEGKHVKLITDGRFNIQNVDETDLVRDEIFADLRLKSVSQLGQVQAAYVEASGEISVFFFEDKDVVPGLPIFPEILLSATEKMPGAGDAACAYCGNVQPKAVGDPVCCHRCGKANWVTASQLRRVL